MTKTIMTTDNFTVFTQLPDVSQYSSRHQSEAELENEFISTLLSQGYTKCEAKTETEIESNLRQRMSELNHHSFSDREWSDFKNNFILKQTDTFIDKTNKIQKDNKYVLTLDNNTQINVQIIDKENIYNNSLQVISQYETETNTRKTRFDVTILVNGLPLVHTELKKRGNDIKEAFRQINRYKRDSFWAGTGLFEYIQLFVISNGTRTRYYSNTVRDTNVKNPTSEAYEFTSVWALEDNTAIHDLIDFTRTFLDPRVIRNILTRYCVFTADDKLLVMRPYQIVATEKILNRINYTHNNKTYGKQGCGGYIWHTTGSGKTLTSFKTSILATNLSYIKKVLFVVDRNDLDHQTAKEYDTYSKDSVDDTKNVKILARKINNDNDKIIVTTIQKLARYCKDKSNTNSKIFNEEVVIIFDECHRSQGNGLFGMQQMISKMFKKYHMFGFTGTPIFEDNKMSTTQTTASIFGERLHTYTIINAINDNTVLHFRIGKVITVQGNEKLQQLDEDELTAGIKTREVLIAPERIKNITEHILKDFNHQTCRSTSNSAIKYNSIFAVDSIEAAKLYYEEFKKYNHNLKITTVYSYSVNSDFDGLREENPDDANGLNKSDADYLEYVMDDYNNMFDTSFNLSNFKEFNKDVSKNMKNCELDILIVVNMYLTGFDSKRTNTLWVDKWLHHHGLIQAFSRTNRIYDKTKALGNIVCFRNLDNAIQQAIKLFSDDANKDVTNIAIMRPFSDYMEGYVDEDNCDVIGFRCLIEELRTYDVKKDIPYDKEDEFVKLYGQILKTHNIMKNYEEWSDDYFTQREQQDYKSIYLQLYEKMRDKTVYDKDSIMEDVSFELELLKHSDYDMNSIMKLIGKELSGIAITENVVDNINRMIGVTSPLYHKKKLIEMFVKMISDGLTVDDVLGVVYDGVNLDDFNLQDKFNDFIDNERDMEIDYIIREYKLDADKTKEIMDNSFRDGEFKVIGSEYNKLKTIKSSKFFNRDKYLETKRTDLKALEDYFMKYR